MADGKVIDIEFNLYPPITSTASLCQVASNRITGSHQVLSELKLAKHPDKTFIGLIERGFDFLGYHFSPDGLRVAQSTLTNFFTNVTRPLIL